MKIDFHGRKDNTKFQYISDSPRKENKHYLNAEIIHRNEIELWINQILDYDQAFLDRILNSEQKSYIESNFEAKDRNFFYGILSKILMHDQIKYHQTFASLQNLCKEEIFLNSLLIVVKQVLLVQQESAFKSGQDSTLQESEKLGSNIPIEAKQIQSSKPQR